MGKIRAASLNDPFLIDECLSPDLAALANSRNHHATHVVFRGLQGAQDSELMPLIRQGGFVLATNNGRDFQSLYAREEPMPDIVNKVVEVLSDGTVEVRDWPEPSAEQAAASRS